MEATKLCINIITVLLLAASNKLTIEQLKVNVNKPLLTGINPHKECITVFSIVNEDNLCYTRLTISWFNYIQASDYVFNQIITISKVKTYPC